MPMRASATLGKQNNAKQKQPLSESRMIKSYTCAALVPLTALILFLSMLHCTHCSWNTCDRKSPTKKGTKTKEKQA